MDSSRTISANFYNRFIMNSRYKLQTVFFVCFFICLITIPTQAKYSGGTGEPNDPYLIATPNDLNSIGTEPNDWSKHFKMIADINLADGFEQLNYIGYFTGHLMSIDNRPFTGVFDGDGHVISNLRHYYDAPNQWYGLALFSYVGGSDAEIKNVGIADPCIFGGEKVSIVGVLVGFLDQGKVNNCYVEGGTVCGEGASVAGLVGSNIGVIHNCFVIDCAVSGSVTVGAIAGNNAFAVLYSGEIESCFARGTVQGNWNIGGLVGLNKGRIENSYAICDVNGQGTVGGLVGQFFCGEILRSYSASRVTGSEDTGAFSGYKWGVMGLYYDGCFWDSQINPGLPGNSNGSDPNLTGLTTAQMQMRDTFTSAGWDMVNIWDIGENQTYPYLRQYPAGDLNHDGIVNFLDFAIFAGHWLAGVK